MSEPFLGEIKLLSFSFAPRGWAPCSGQMMPINQNQALFSLLGTTYGGNGQVNFALPNLQGRVPIHFGDIARGSVGGEAAHTLSVSEMPVHMHVMQASQNQATDNAPGPTMALAASNGAFMYTPPSALVAMSPTMVGNRGGSQPHTNLQPYLALNFCIALQGFFPTQN